VSLDLERCAEGAPEGAVLVTVAGELELQTAHEFTRSVERISRGYGDAVVLDLSMLTFLDLNGLAAIVALLRATEAHGARLAVVSPNGRISRRFDVTGLNEVLGVVPTREQAFAAVNGAS
jgi:anti-sigma B factor antagonist